MPNRFLSWLPCFTRNRTSPQPVLVLAALLLAVTAALGQDEMADWLDPRLGQLQTSLSYDVEHHEQQSVRDSSEQMGPLFQEMSFSLPLFQNEKRELGLTVGYERADFNTGADFPDSEEDFPEIYEDYTLAFAYRQWLTSERQIGVMAQIGSPSDDPYDSFDDIAIDVNAMYRQNASGRDAWSFLVNFSTNRGWLNYIPLPGVAYSLSREKVQALIGIPINMVRWQPTKQSSLLATYIPARNINVRAGYEIAQPIEVYTGFSWENRSYFRANRQDDDNRVEFYSKKVTGGIAWEVNESFTVDFRAGYAFDRFVFEGEDYEDRNRDRIEFSDGPFYGVRGKVKF